MESRLLRIYGNGPFSVFSLGHRVNLAADIYGYLLCHRKTSSELNAEIRIHLRILTSGSIC